MLVGPLPLRRLRRAAAARSPGTAWRTRVAAREGARRVAIANGGTIPDRGLYGVFLAGGAAGAGAGGRARRGDGLRERPGRDLPARRLHLADRGDHPRPGAGLAGAGRAGQDALLARRRGRAAARARAAHRRAGARAAERAARARPATRLAQRHDLDARRGGEPPPLPRRPARGHRRRPRRPRRWWSSACATSWATGASACSRRSAGRVHAPWAMAVAARVRERDRARRRDHVDRRRLRGALPGRRTSPRTRLLLSRGPDEVEALVLRQLGGHALFAAQVSARRPAGPCSCPGGGPAARTPLWQQRKRAADLLAVASRFGSLPHPARDLPRVPARRLRPAGAGGDAAGGGRAARCAS